jgi:hypothetical protein
VKGNSTRAVADPAAVADYKRILQQVLENRPAGTRLRLAEALGKNRSFISQITNPNYSVPIPARHIEPIFEICHFLAGEKAQFLQIYRRAHPHRAPDRAAEARFRDLVVRVPDLRDRERNRQLDQLVKDMAQRVARLLEDGA